MCPRHLVVSVLVATVLAACGDDSTGPAATSASATTSATTSAANAISPATTDERYDTSTTTEVSKARDTSEPTDASTVPPVGSGPVIDPGDGGNYAPVIDPAAFVDRVDNPYFPLTPGSRWTYHTTGADGDEDNTVEVTTDRKMLMGVSTTVVHDTVMSDGQPVEDTFDYYAQDHNGNVWYFGESVHNFDAGKFSNTDGSFEAGADGALPGIVMLAQPAVGKAYRQEFYRGRAEDLGQVLAVGQHAEATFGAFDDVIVTRDWNPLEPDVVEEKSYAPGVGVIAEKMVAGGDEQSVLVDFQSG
jgi:hypothetical protein